MLTDDEISITSTSSTSPKSGMFKVINSGVPGSTEISLVSSLDTFFSSIVSDLSSFEISFSPSCVSISRNGIPSVTLSPIFTKSLEILPCFEAGISIAALSLSKTIIVSSLSTS